MKFFSVAIAVLGCSTFVCANVAAEFDKRACGPTSCSCQSVPNGLFCGDGLFNCIPGHVYQCGGDGHLSCDFGVRKSCQDCGKLQCP